MEIQTAKRDAHYAQIPRPPAPRPPARFGTLDPRFATGNPLGELSQFSQTHDEKDEGMRRRGGLPEAVERPSIIAHRLVCSAQVARRQTLQGIIVELRRDRQ